MERANLLTPTDFLPALPILLYAETHYKFRFFFSRLWKSEPELIADAPHRLEPGEPLPILFIVKDADRYPCTLKQIEVTILYNGKVINKETLLDKPTQLGDHWWWKTWSVKRPPVSGWIDCDVAMQIEKNGKLRTYHNDNLISSSRKPLRVFLSDNPMPRLKDMHFGDAHTHSYFTEDQVEFGAPLAASKTLSKSMGLSFFCVTDHSYDLDDRRDDYLSNDSLLPKWLELKRETKKINSQNPGFTVLSGEEVSTRNCRGKNVHLLLIGNDEFFHGSGDGAERWLRTRSENTITEILKQKESTSVSFAAHPLEHVPFLQKILLGRDIWNEPDFEQNEVDGIQFANGNFTSGFEVGYHAWVRLLLKGKKCLALAGNDAHGNFNRFRQIKIPFMSIHEHHRHLFGKMRTGVFMRAISSQSLLRALKTGSFVITDGPVANIKRRRENSATSIGKSYTGKKFDFEISTLSSAEFGSLQEVKVFMGTIGSGQEDVIVNDRPRRMRHNSSASIRVSAQSYIRIEAHTSNENQSDRLSHFCYSNPIWLTP